MNSNFIELLEAFIGHGVRFLVVGGYAFIEYCEPRFTKDLDLWVEATPDNSARVHSALIAFGAPLFGATAKDFATPGNILQLGVAPARIDILTSIDGVDFSEAWGRRVSIDFDGVAVSMISLIDLIKNKESTSRPRDKEDAAMLKEAAKFRKV